MRQSSFQPRRAPRRAGNTVRIVVGLSPLWIGALFLTLPYYPADAERPIFAGMAAIPENVPPENVPPENEPPLATAEAAAAGADLAGIPAADAAEDADAAERPRLAQQWSDDDGVLSQSTYEAVTVPQPVWRMEPPAPRPERNRPRPRTYPEAPAVRPDPLRDDAGMLSQDRARLARARVVIHRPRGEARHAASELLDGLQARGVGEAEIRTVGVTLSGTDIRYFHPQDRAIAEALDRMLERHGHRAELRDFTHYSPRPSRGSVEVWLPG